MPILAANTIFYTDSDVIDTSSKVLYTFRNARRQVGESRNNESAQDGTLEGGNCTFPKHIL
jgi:hypothetical protein